MVEGGGDAVGLRFGGRGMGIGVKMLRGTVGGVTLQEGAIAFTRCCTWLNLDKAGVEKGGERGTRGEGDRRCRGVREGGGGEKSEKTPKQDETSSGTYKEKNKKSEKKQHAFKK